MARTEMLIGGRWRPGRGLGTVAAAVINELGRARQPTPSKRGGRT